MKLTLYNSVRIYANYCVRGPGVLPACSSPKFELGEKAVCTLRLAAGSGVAATDTGEVRISRVAFVGTTKVAEIAAALPVAMNDSAGSLDAGRIQEGGSKENGDVRKSHLARRFSKMLDI